MADSWIALIRFRSFVIRSCINLHHWLICAIQLEFGILGLKILRICSSMDMFFEDSVRNCRCISHRGFLTISKMLAREAIMRSVLALVVVEIICESLDYLFVPRHSHCDRHFRIKSTSAKTSGFTIANSFKIFLASSPLPNTRDLFVTIILKIRPW